MIKALCDERSQKIQQRLDAIRRKRLNRLSDRVHGRQLYLQRIGTYLEDSVTALEEQVRHQELITKALLAEADKLKSSAKNLAEKGEWKEAYQAINLAYEASILALGIKQVQSRTNSLVAQYAKQNSITKKTTEQTFNMRFSIKKSLAAKSYTVDTKTQPHN